MSVAINIHDPKLEISDVITLTKSFKFTNRVFADSLFGSMLSFKVKLHNLNFFVTNLYLTSTIEIRGFIIIICDMISIRL